MEMTFIYFVYGLAFFSLGLALRFESTRAPSLARPQALFALMVFGLIHGTHEWLEMLINHSDWMPLRTTPVLVQVRLLLLAISFIALILFGIWMLVPDSGGGDSRAKGVFWAGAGVMTALFGIGWLAGGKAVPAVFLDVAARYLLAVPGAALAALGLGLRSKKYADGKGSRLSRFLKLAGFAFLIYSLSQIVVPPLNLFPADRINTEVFMYVIGVPVQVIRAGAAILIAVCMINVVNQLERLRQDQFYTAEHERMEALERLRLELLAREEMRQDLLRHIVLAQEDERARVARELHDETSQILTAFTYHLAVLRQTLSKQSKSREQIEYLQSLSRQMSQGIYRLVRDLRPAQLDDLGLTAALEYLVDEQAKRTGLEVRLRIQGEKRRLDTLEETVLFRVAQEAVTNIARHSGVKTARLEVTFLPDAVEMLVADEGIGFDLERVESTGSMLGLLGMRERVESIGGSLKILTAPGGGTRVLVATRNRAAETIDRDQGSSLPRPHLSN